jgi:hypothetical protein
MQVFVFASFVYQLSIFDPLSSLTAVDAIIDNDNALPVQQSSLLDHLVSKAQQDIYVLYHNRQDISSIKNSVQFDEMKELQNIVEDTLNYLQALKDKYIANINRTIDMQR